MYPLIFGPIDTLLGPIAEWVLLLLVAVNLVTRHRAHAHHRRLADADSEVDPDEIGHTRPHLLSNLLLVLVSFYFMTVDVHYGTIVSVMAVALVLTDFFETESRRVELRTEQPLERPRASLVLSGILFVYVIYVSLFFIVEPAVRVVV